MQVMIRNEIPDYFEDTNLNFTEYLYKLIELAANDFPIVSFTLDNSIVLSLDDDKSNKLIEVCKFKQVDKDDIILLSTLIASGFIELIKGYANTIEENIRLVK
jgi:hypothetical protein